MADTVAILREGRLVRTATIPELRAQVVRRWDVTFTHQVPLEVLQGCPQVSEVHVHDRTAHLVLAGSAESLLRTVARTAWRTS